MIKLSKRHLAKTITWRILGTIDTIVLSWFILGDFSMAFKIGGFELITKMLLYYFHERLWFKSKIIESNKRHIFKTFSWRAIGTLDTIILSWIISGNPLAGLKIGGSEVGTKMILYYLHEKLWYRINFGLDKRLKRMKEKRGMAQKMNQI
ncbi:DUF2061 domain-containing protein [Polaribacter litorisediminis]|uniref:DUF2061 domain-containing protein n=1 Tax=Polaribacter litorisediminis TaxID=1908341 RepID=UPI001CBB988F|nr:DUF2061 domain-containing protein [Polaribacter litorisediminis]UAM96646.1 DUF2061 domain-containing protein [Polaribacter litorisediminis]